MADKVLAREEVLAWNSGWSFTDRQTIEEHLDRLDARTFYVPPSGGYIGCVDPEGVKVMFIHAGYVQFKDGLAPEDRPSGWQRSIPLSTFSPHASPSFEREPNEQFCEVHNLALPLSGLCDECEA